MWLLYAVTRHCQSRESWHESEHDSQCLNGMTKYSLHHIQTLTMHEMEFWFGVAKGWSLDDLIRHMLNSISHFPHVNAKAGNTNITQLNRLLANACQNQLTSRTSSNVLAAHYSKLQFTFCSKGKIKLLLSLHYSGTAINDHFVCWPAHYRTQQSTETQ